ncbi:MAG: hypothetical protein RLZZ292_4043 [Bacteroidota bacterium]|jgi:hypothetical protein
MFFNFNNILKFIQSPQTPPIRCMAAFLLLLPMLAVAQSGTALRDFKANVVKDNLATVLNNGGRFLP